MENFWQSTVSPRPSYTALNGHIHTDVCVIGGGITGVTTALQLANAGKEVVLLEAHTLGAGTTGASSNHLNTDIDFSYRNVQKNFDEKIARIVLESRRKGIDYIENNVQQYGIDCDFRRVNGFLYAEEEEQLEELEEEYKAALDVGLRVSKTRDTSLPFPVKMAIQFEDQGEFNALKYVSGVAKQLEQLSCKIFENSRVVAYDKDDRVIKTENGSVTAQDIVFATHLPLFINVHQTTSAPYRSYMMVAKVENYPAEALYWDMYDPYHYTRIYQQNGEPWLVVGGADHKTGHDDHSQDYHQQLEDYLRQRYKVKEIAYRWSSQYYEPADGLPYIGLSPFENTYMATGFSGDGLVYGTIAGILMADMMLRNSNEWLEAYDARRFKPVASAKDFLEHNLDVGKQMIGKRLISEDLENIQLGEGRVVKHHLKQYAVYKDTTGQLKVCSAVCTHLKCIVRWNHMEKTWDCACHGSRFDPEGKVLTGPATIDLKKAETETIADLQKDIQ